MIGLLAQASFVEDLTSNFWLALIIKTVLVMGFFLVVPLLVGYAPQFEIVVMLRILAPQRQQDDGHVVDFDRPHQPALDDRRHLVLVRVQLVVGVEDGLFAVLAHVKPQRHRGLAGRAGSEQEEREPGRGAAGAAGSRIGGVCGVHWKPLAVGARAGRVATRPVLAHACDVPQ